MKGSKTLPFVHDTKDFINLSGFGLGCPNPGGYALAIAWIAITSVGGFNASVNQYRRPVIKPTRISS